MNNYKKFFELYATRFPQCATHQDDGAFSFWEQLFQAFKQRLMEEIQDEARAILPGLIIFDEDGNNDET